jgi:lipoate---protein ligase
MLPITSLKIGILFSKSGLLAAMWIDDQILERHDQAIEIRNFVPDSPLIVLGSSNVPDTEVNLAYCLNQGIPVEKRYGGGGTVVLYSGCVVVSAGIWVRQHFQNQEYFRRINQAVIDVLAEINPVLKELDQRGLSDISFNGRKIAGTSLFRSRNYLLYQGSVVVAPNLQLINNCLLHPTKEPDYRAGRSHGDFLISLKEICGLDVDEVRAKFDLKMKDSIVKNLGAEFIGPDKAQFPALIARLQRSRSGNS